MEDTEMVKLLTEMLFTRISEIESIVDAINSIDSDYLWKVSDHDIDDAIDTLNAAYRAAKRELKERA